MFNLKKKKLRFRTSASLHFCATVLTSFMFYNIKSTTIEFKRLLLTEEAHVRIKPGKPSTRPNEASTKTYTTIKTIFKKWM